jgi:hypothetical protein
MPIKEAIFESKGESERTWVCAREWRERESCNGSSLAAIATAVRAPKRAGSRVEWSDPPSPCIVLYPFSSL